MIDPFEGGNFHRFLAFFFFFTNFTCFFIYLYIYVPTFEVKVSICLKYVSLI